MPTIAQEKGRLFEDFVGEVLQGFAQRHGLKCGHFGPAFQPDGGKDFVITTPSQLKRVPRLFGVTLRANTRYIVEAKYLTPKEGAQQKLGFSRFISNLSQAKLDSAAAIFLVTSSQISPQSLYTAAAVTGRRDFLVPVPGIWISRLAETLGISRPHDLEIAPLTGTQFGDGLVADVHQATRRAGGSELKYYYIALYNDSGSPKAVEILGQSADDWSFIEAGAIGDYADPRLDAFNEAKQVFERTETVDPGGILSIGLVGRMKRGRISASGHVLKAEVRILARCGDAVEELARQSAGFEPIYLPRFMGRAHKKAAAIVAEMVSRRSKGLQLLLVTGDAGVGKSRTIDEALSRIDDAQFDIFSYTLESAIAHRKGGRNTDREAFNDFAKTVMRTLFGQEASKEPLRNCRSVTDVISRVRDFRRGKLSENLKVPIFVIEDLHHVDANVARDLAALTKETPSDEPPCFIILAGRDDSTFDNRYCWMLYADLKSASASEHIHDQSSIRIEPLDTRTARTLISSIVDNIQEGAIERILRLSGPIPNNIIQCIEFLLDQSLIEIASNATLSIVDQLTFERRSQSFPRSMSELFATRFEFLGTDETGERSKRAIVAATFFGTYIPEAVLELDFDIDGAQATDVAAQLVSRRFLRKSYGEFYEWSHESLLLYFDTLARSIYFEPHRTIARCVKSAAVSVAQADVFQTLPRLDQGRVAALAGLIDIAIARWAPMFSSLHGISSFAAAEMKSDYYDQADAAIGILASENKVDEDLVASLILMKAYVGAVFRSLVFCENAYRTGREWLRRIELSDPIKISVRYRLDQILTHCLMDSGFPGIALRSALELEARLPFVPRISDDMAFVFDVHNTLRLIYTYTNFYTLAEAQGNRAAEAARLSGDRELQAMDLGDRALLHFYNDWALCRSLNVESLAVREELPARRGSWHSLVSTIAIDLSARQSDDTWLAQSAQTVEKVIRDCRYDRYHSVLPRMYLLLAAIIDLLQRKAPTDQRWHEGEEIIDLGLDSCERFSIGYISWQLHNLRAVRAARRSEWRLATRAIRTAAMMIYKEGLTFLGDGPLVSAVPIVLANFIKIMKRASTDREIAGMLSRIRGFSQYDLGERDARLRCEQQAYRTAAILCEDAVGPPFSLLLDTESNLGITVWF